MSVYNPPTQDQSIFNPSNYGGLGVGGEITTDYLKANFLAFPVAQGNITLVSTNVLGDITQTGDYYTSGDINADDITGDVITGTSILVGTNNLLTEITTNSSAITTATSNITALQSQQTTNTSQIATNTSAIATNTSAIATNTANITTNTTNIGTNTSAITALQTLTSADTIRIGDLETLTASHTTDIGGNTTNIATNTSAITALQTLTASHTTDIAGNATDITALQTLTASHTTDIAGNTSAIATKQDTITTSTDLVCNSITTEDDGTNKIGRLTIDNDGDLIRIKNSTVNILSHNTSNTNTVLNAGNHIFFSAGGGTQGRFTSTGLRLGTGTPNEKLDVIGNVIATGSITGNSLVSTTSITGASLLYGTTNVATKISTIESNISTNSTNISTNTSDIATNTSAIATKQDTLTASSNITTGTINAGTITIRSGEQLTTPIVSATTSITAPTITASTNLFYGVNNVATKISGLDTRLTTAESDIDALETQQALNTTAILNIAVNATNIGDNGANIATLQTLTASHTTDIAGNATDITALQSLTASHTTDIAGNTTNIATNTSNIATNTSAIATKQDIITDGSLTIARTSGLQTALDSKQPTITNGSLTIAQTSGLQTALDGKQPTIADADLTIAKTSGLQTALDSKQPTITDASLTIARTIGLQTALDSKQATINDGDLTIARTSGLQTALDGKQATIADGDLTIAKTSGLQTALDSKEATITSSTDLTINSLTTSTALIDERIAGSMFLSNKVKTATYNYALKQTSGGAVSLNTVSNTSLELKVNNVATLAIDADGLTMETDKYLESVSNYAFYYSGGNVAMTGTSHLVEFNTTILASSLITKTSNSRYTINRAGYYRISSSLQPENTAINDRIAVRGLFLKNGVENSIWSSDSFSYIRDDDFGDFGTNSLDGVLNLSVNDYIEVEITAKIGSAASFASDLTGVRMRVRSNLTFQYLGS